METFAFLKPVPDFIIKSKKGMNPAKYNGYVAFKGDLPLSWQGAFSQNKADLLNRDKCLDDMINVHGGITFDMDKETSEGYLTEEPIIPLTAIPYPIKGYRIIGFDCQHCEDTNKNCNYKYIVMETLSLLKQVKKLLTESNQ